MKSRQRRHRLLRRDVRLVTFRVSQAEDFFPSPIFKSQFHPLQEVVVTKRMDTAEYNKLMARLGGKSYLVV